MNTAEAVALGSPFTHQQSGQRTFWRPSKPKLNSLLQHKYQEAFGYPSPPMSSPPSPPRLRQELTSNTSSEPTTSVVATPSIHSFLGLPTTLPGIHFAPLPPPPPQYPPGFQGQISGPPFIAVVAGAFNLGGVAGVSPVVVGTPSVAGTGPARPGRKSRGHVASACINCKKAHLSCDVQRPCSRCVSSGKQVRSDPLNEHSATWSLLTFVEETCVDVQHKKRGRPRLRDENEFQVEQMMPGPASQPPVTFASSPTSTRPIAGTRHRRTESLRSLRSQTSDSSGASALPTPTYLPPPAPPRHGLQPLPFPGAALSVVDVPTAYLDLDLTFIRANNAFQQAISAGQDVRGRRLDEIAASADANTFQSIRTQLREEREAREPSYMPPIVQQSQDLLQGVSDADVDQITRGSTDRTYIWTPNQPNVSRERFTARVKLARTNTYFVVVTLPPVRQTGPAQPAALSSPFAIPASATTQSYSPYGPGATYTAPPSYYGTQPGQPAAPSQQQAPPGPPYPGSYGSYYAPPPAYQPQPQPYLPPPATPRIATSGPSSETTAFTPPTAPRQPATAFHESLHLPPIAGTSPAAGPPVPAQPESQPRRSSSEDDGDDERSPKKRRRVGIHDVLQQ